MDMTPVTSSNIAAVGYDNGTMRVRFTNGTQYDYPNVPADLHKQFMESESKGRFFGSKIRSQFKGSKYVPEPEPQTA